MHGNIDWNVPRDVTSTSCATLTPSLCGHLTLQLYNFTNILHNIIFRDNALFSEIRTAGRLRAYLSRLVSETRSLRRGGPPSTKTGGGTSREAWWEASAALRGGHELGVRGHVPLMQEPAAFLLLAPAHAVLEHAPCLLYILYTHASHSHQCWLFIGAWNLGLVELVSV